MNKRFRSIATRAAVLAFLTMMLLPITVSAQRRWGNRSYRNRVVIYQPRPYVIYQRRPAYTYRYNTRGYSQPYYSTQYYSNGYSQPYYEDRYYSNVYTRPYYVNRYAWSSPSYWSGYYGPQPRYRRNRFRVGIWLR
jgi:hypothetical protein